MNAPYLERAKMTPGGTIMAYATTPIRKGKAVKEQPHSDDWLTVSEISELTGYSTGALRQLAINTWSTETPIQARKSGGVWLIRFGRVQQHIEEKGYGPYGPRDDSEG